jgi:predicted DsbA family dithiol-disulfide isomerase
MQVEIWSDVVCPWCYIGKRRFERALEAFPHADEVSVTYRSFELDPGAPSERTGSHTEHLTRKYGISVERADQMHAQMTEVAATEGVEFRFDLMRGGNTFDAHRLLHLARKYDRQLVLKEQLLRATFTDGQPVADKDILVRIAGEAGIPTDEARAVLDGNAYSDDVRADEQQAAQYGITGVPFFVVDGKYGVSGAQPSDVLSQLLEGAYAESTPLTVIAAGDDAAACDGDSCAV